MQLQTPHHTQTTQPASARIPGRHEHTAIETAPARRTPSSASANIAPVVDRIRTRLAANLGANRVRRYLSGSVRIEETDTGIAVSATDTFTLDMIERRVGDDLRDALRAELGLDSARVEFKVRHLPASTKPTPANIATPLPTTPAPTAPAAPRARCPKLSEFIVGSSNRVAFEAVRRILEDPMQTLPTFLHGTCGVGKTHLLRGTIEHYRRLHPGARVRYTTGEAFTNEYAGSVRKNEVEAFKKKYRRLDLLCIDDIHLMAGKGGTQTELLQVFNTLSLGGARILLASDEHPREIKRFNDALLSRFASGVVVRIDPPETELARKLIIQHASKIGLRLDDAGIGTIIERVGVGSGATARDLEGAVTQIEAVSRLMDSDPSQTGTIQIRRALDLRAPASKSNRHTGPISMPTIISAVCESLCVTRTDLGGRGRQKKVVLARELCVHLAKNLTTRSTPEIAHAIGRPNHSTVITAANRIKDKIAKGLIVDVCCAHDGVPIGELAQTLTNQIQTAHAGR